MSFAVCVWAVILPRYFKQFIPPGPAARTEKPRFGVVKQASPHAPFRTYRVALAPVPPSRGSRLRTIGEPPSWRPSNRVDRLIDDGEGRSQGRGPPGHCRRRSGPQVPCICGPQAQGGRTQSRNSGADVFLLNSQGEYIGRTCQWRECAPGVRIACRADHCGRRPYLYDDLCIVKLRPELVSIPSLELWPGVVAHGALPGDVKAWVASVRKSVSASSHNDD